MPAQALKQKLRATLTTPIATEERLLFAFATVRKILEHEKPAGLDGLRFHCNWLLHTALSKDVAKELIQNLDSYQVMVDLSMVEDTLTVNAGDMEQLNALDDLLSFRRFRRELKDFLATHHLPTGIVTDVEWPEILRLYISSVQGVPVQYEKGKKTEIKPEVTTVTVSLVDYKPAGVAEFRIIFVWDWPNGSPDFPIGMRRVIAL